MGLAWVSRAFLLALLSPLLIWTAPLSAAAPASVRPRAQVVPDSAAARADTVETVGDSLGVPPDSLAAASDSVEVFVPRNIALRPTPVPAGWATGIWEWDREGLRSAKALTLLELLEEIPGVTALRGGDYGQPSTVTAFGAGAGEVRVFIDGAEMAPLDGGVVDLARVGISALDRVRVERRPGELRVDLFPLSFDDPRPQSYLEVGTGDFNTNIFRGLFAHPNALGGTVDAAIDRLETGGPQTAEPGVSAGADARYVIFPMEGLGVELDYRHMNSRRPPELWQPEEVGRTEWGIRARYAWAPWLHGGIFYQRSSLSVGSGDSQDTAADSLINEKPRTQLGAHVSVERGAGWAEAEYREQWGPGWASSEQTLRGGVTAAEIGGASIDVERQSWSGGRSALMAHGRVWSRPFHGFSVFGEVENGSRGVPYWVPPPTPEDTSGGGASAGRAALGPLRQTVPAETSGEDPPSIVERTGIRGGLEYRRGDLFVGAALLSVDADTLHPMGLPTDRDGITMPGGRRTGFETSAELPLSWIVRGLELRGSAQFWSQGEPWRYLPERSYDAKIAFHDVYYESRNLEVWADVGVQGRDPMAVPFDVSGSPGVLEEVPFQQSWFARLQIRVVSARLFVQWDNFTLRPKNQDYPGRVLPQTRALYGIRWTLWN